jgi:excisionase family DNA binding protein
MSGIEAARQVLEEAARDERRAEKLLTVAIAAKRLDVCTETVRRWVKAGRLPSLRYPSGQFRIPESAVEKILTTPYHI